MNLTDILHELVNEPQNEDLLLDVNGFLSTCWREANFQVHPGSETKHFEVSVHKMTRPN